MKLHFAEVPDIDLGFENTWMVNKCHIGNGQATKLAALSYAYALIDRLEELASAVPANCYKM